MSATTANTLADRFAWMIEWLCKAMAAEAHKRRVEGPLAIALWNRLRRYGRRFAALYAKWQAGKLPAPRARRPREAPAQPAASRPPGELWRFNWFRKLLPATATALAATLIELMQRPEMIALVAAAPQAGRILRPMCWMVGIERQSICGCRRDHAGPGARWRSAPHPGPAPQRGRQNGPRPLARREPRLYPCPRWRHPSPTTSRRPAA